MTNALNDEHLLMTWDGTVVLKDGTRHPIEYNITVGMARQYMADPHPCQCENCQRVMTAATRILGIQEDFFAGRIKEKQLVRALKQMGYRREGKIQHH